MNHSISMEPHKDTTTQNELPDVEVFRKVFKHYSQQAQQLNPSLNLHVPDEILREDIIPCLKSALNQPIDLAPRYILNCFAIDTSAKITWKEFQLSLERMNLVKKQQGKGGVTTRSHSKLMDARKRGRVLGPQPQLVHETPLTTSQVCFFSLSLVDIKIIIDSVYQPYTPTRILNIFKNNNN